MSSIDERVVQMRFDNAQFNAGVKDTNSSLDDLKKGLDLGPSTRGLEALQAAGDSFDLSSIADGVDSIADRFSNLGIVAVAALATITSQAITAGTQFVKSFTVAPITAGLEEYQTNLNAIQTILSNTQSEGATLQTVNKALNELNTYSDKTIYNFSEMARNIGTFTAAGVKLDTSTKAIKGTANLAALSGSNAQQASSAMYQLSQALAGAGLRLQDYNSLVNAGIGGKVFQEAIKTTARAHGVAVDAIIKKNGSFRASLQDGYVTSEILAETLNTFSGDLSKSQLKAMGYTDKQTAAIIKQAKAAQDAATKVKTLPQLISTLQEAIGSGYSQSFQYIFGDFDQAKELFTSVNNVLSSIISASSKSRNNILKTFSEDGGRAAAITAISQAFTALMNILDPVRKAFASIFPPLTGQVLISFTESLSVFTQSLQNVTKRVGPEVYRTFRGIFAVLDIGRLILVGVIKTLGGLFGQVGSGTGSFLSFTATIGDFLVKLHDAIIAGNGLNTFFEGLGAVLKVPIALIQALAGALSDLVTGADAGQAFDGVTKKIQPLTIASDFLLNVWTRFGAAVNRIFEFARPALNALGDAFVALGERINSALTNVDYDKIVAGVNTGLFAGLVILVRKFIKDGLNFNFNANVGGSLFEPIKNAFEGLTGTLTAMQQNLKANVLLKIAAALAILTASVVALSLIDPVALAKATGAMVAMFTQLGVAMALFGKISLGPSIAQMPVLTTSMILLATAIAILAAAVKTLSGIDLPGLIQGLGGVIILLGAIAGTAKLVNGSAKNLIPLGVGMIAIATAVRILVGAVAELGALDIASLASGLVAVAAVLATIAGFTRIVNPKKMLTTGIAVGVLAVGLKVLASVITQLGSLNPETLGKGLGAIAVGLAIMAGALKLIPVTLVAQAVAIGIVAGSLLLMAKAITIFSNLSWEEIGRGLTVLGGTLGLLAGALYLMEAALPGAAALIIAAGALAIFAPAIVSFGSMDWESIGKAMVVLAGVLLLLSGALYLMEVALPGAAALIVAAQALAILGPVLVALGSLSWEEIARGLAILAGAFVIIGVAGAVLTPVIPTLLGLAGAIALLGLGAALAGIGVLAFATGLTALGVAGAAGAAGLTVTFTAILDLIPLALTKLGEGIVALAGVVEQGAPAIVQAIVAVLVALIDAIGTIAPKIVNTLIDLIVLLAQTLARGVPQLYQAGYKLLLGVLTAIANNIGKVVTVATSIIVNFLNAIGKNLPRITDAGAKLVISFVNGLADSIRKNTDAMNRAGTNLARAIIDGMTSGLTNGVKNVIQAARGVAQGALDAAKNLLGIHSPSKEFEKLGVYSTEGYVKGLTGSSDNIRDAFKTMKDMLKDLIDSSADDMENYQDRIYDLTQSVKDSQKAVDDQRKTLTKAQTDTRKGTYAKDEQKKLDELVKTRNRDTREIRDQQAAIKEAEAKQKSGKTAAARKSAEKAENNARQRIADLTDKRNKDNDAIKAQQDILNQVKKDQKNNVYVTDAQDKLNKLTRARDKDNKALQEAKDGLRAAQDENPKAKAAYDDLTQSQVAQEAQLESLSKAYDDLDKQIDDQKQAYTDAKKTLDDYSKSIKDQYSSLDSFVGSADAPVTLDSYLQSTQEQLDKVLDYTSQLQELRRRGLNDKLYDKLLKQGTDAIPFVTQLLDSGQNGLGDLNSLADQLDAAAGNLGSLASTSLYQAGVDSARGILVGLQSQQSAITDQMNAIAASMVQAVRDKLGIKSPSRVFAEVGGYSMEGLAGGINDASGLVATAAENAGTTAISSLKQSISGIASAVATDMDMNPTIRPVLDLSAIQEGAGAIGGILGRPVLSTDGVYTSAGAANDGYLSNRQAMLDAKDTYASDIPGTTVFNQYNSSPKALSQAEIYRQTKNQLSVAKGA